MEDCEKERLKEGGKEKGTQKVRKRQIMLDLLGAGAS
jgi:hypothetical protein